MLPSDPVSRSGTPGPGAAPHYAPMLSEESARRIRKWHDAAYEDIRKNPRLRVSYLGLDLVVPEDVFPSAPMSELLGNVVLEEVRSSDRVLDMGTGSGVNAILAASASTDAVGVDINPHAVESAIANAARNGVAARTSFFQSDVFEAVEGTFDLIIFDPPFRWFAPRDLLEVSVADENYRALTSFMTEARGYLNEDGRVLVFFGTSGDIDYLYSLTDRAGFKREVVASRQLTKDDLTVTYFTFRLTP